MKDKISFSDLKSKFTKNSAELEEIDRLNINYKNIIANKKKMIENYEQIISSIKPDNQKDFETQSKDYMEKIYELENEIREDEEKAGRKEKLIKENKKIIEDAKKRKENLEKQVLEDYERDKKDEEKNMSDDVKKAKEELENYESQLAKMEEEERKFPNKVKDSKYKEFLKNKIAEKNKYIEENSISSAEEVKEFLLNEIKEEYLVFKKGLSKEYMPEEAKNPNPVLEAAKKKRQMASLQDSNGAGLPELKKGTKVIIGRRGKISYDGKEYKVSARKIKRAVNMMPDEVISLLEENKFKISKELEEAIKTGLTTGTVDATVLSTICSAKKMPSKDRKVLLANYLKDGIMAANKKDAKNSINLVYDQEDMSKSSIIKRIFKREINAEEKYKMLKTARAGERYGVAKINGEYNPTLKSRFISLVSRNKIEALPTMSETQEVAETFNNMRDSLKVDTSNFSKAQKVELKELKQSQEKQEQR